MKPRLVSKSIYMNVGPEESLLRMVKLRASQMNECAFCIDMHWKDLRSTGEADERLQGLDAWREFPLYSDRERAGLVWTDAVTTVQSGHVPDDVYEAYESSSRKRSWRI